MHGQQNAKETYISATSSAVEEVISYGLQATCSWHCTATRFIGLYVYDVVRLQPKLAWVEKCLKKHTTNYHKIPSGGGLSFPCWRGGRTQRS
jgi:hypothetical protein